MPGCCCLPFWAGMFQFSSVKLLPTPMQIQKDKKRPRFLRQYTASTRKHGKLAHSSCISVSRERGKTRGNSRGNF